MGMYTRFKFAAALREDTPAAAVDVLRWLVSDRKSSLTELPNHPLFACAHWEDIGHGAMSYWATPPAPPRFERTATGWHLAFECAFRNYAGEIDKFCAWLAPFVEEVPDTLLGEIETQDDDMLERDPAQLFAQAGAIERRERPRERDDRWWAA